jgi:Ser/Thr protein kinase RdoA (MazF antagonist)
MEWLAFLHKRGIPVSMPLPMNDGRLVALIESNNKYHDVCAFEKATGTHCNVNNPKTWNADIMEDWGYCMGRMHHETKRFELSDKRYARETFDGCWNWSLDRVNESISQAPNIQKFAQELVSYLISLPRTRDTFGLIHNDFHQNNFFVNNNKVHVFDFDDSIYGYFALDIGIALNEVLAWSASENIDSRQSEAENIVFHFMKGYRKANTLDEQSLRSIVKFMQYRQLCNFGWDYEPDYQMLEEQNNILNGFTMQGCKINEEMFIL